MRFNEFKANPDPLGLSGTIWDPEVLKGLSSGLKGQADMSSVLKKLGMDKGAFDLSNDAPTDTAKSIGKGPGDLGKRASNITTGSGKPSEELIQFVKRKEGFKSKAFWDYKQYTNGYGTKASGPNEKINEQEADRRLREKAQEFYDIVVRFDHTHKYGFTDNQRDALTSFVFNGGPGWLNQVSSNGQRSKEQIAQAMLNYTNAGSKKLPGLVRRRREEVAMFNAGSNIA